MVGHQSFDGSPPEGAEKAREGEHVAQKRTRGDLLSGWGSKISEENPRGQQIR